MKTYLVQVIVPTIIVTAIILALRLRFLPTVADEDILFVAMNGAFIGIGPLIGLHARYFWLKKRLKI